MWLTADPVSNRDYQKEKNKELEAKARDMERKWLHEKTLREAAESKVKALKKKLRSTKENGISHVDADEAKEDGSVATHQTVGGVLSRSNSIDGLELISDHAICATGGTHQSSSSSNAEASKVVAALSLAGQEDKSSAGLSEPSAPHAFSAAATTSSDSSAKESLTTQASPPRDFVSGAPYRHVGPNPMTPPVTQKKVSPVCGTSGGASSRSGSFQMAANGQPTKPNLVMNQQFPPQQLPTQQLPWLNGSQSPGSNFQPKASPFIDPNQQTPPGTTRPPFSNGPSRPMSMAHRNESNSSMASSRRSVSYDFDPLGPLATEFQRDDGLSFLTGVNLASAPFYSTPVFMMDSQTGQMGQTAALLVSPTPLMQVTAQQIDSSSGIQAQSIQWQPPTDNQIPAGGMLLSFLEQPTLLGPLESSTTATAMQPNSMSYQQHSFEQSQWDQPQSSMPPQQSLNQQPIVQPHDYAAMPQEQDGLVHQHDSNLLQPGIVDPFEALVKQRNNNP